MTLLNLKQYIFIFKFIALSSFIYASDFKEDSIDEMSTLSKKDLRQKLRNAYDKNIHLQEELERKEVDLLKVRKQRNHQQKCHHFYKEKYIKFQKKGKKVQSEEPRIKMKIPTLLIDQSQSKKSSIHKTSSAQENTKNAPVQVSHDAIVDIHVEHLDHEFTDPSQSSASPIFIKPPFDHWSSFNR